MNLKKIATLILFAVLIFGISKNTVSAAASNKKAKTATGEAVSSKKSSSKKKAPKKKKKNYTKGELRLMSAIINAEAGSESYQGKLAVGIVIMNRISSKQFPNTLKGVIFQSGQFSPVRNGALRSKLSQYDSGKTKTNQWKDCIRAAKRVLEGRNYVITNGSQKSLKGYHFFSVYLSGSRFRLGGHRFK